jgi:hypothetical protein
VLAELEASRTLVLAYDFEQSLSRSKRGEVLSLLLERLVAGKGTRSFRWSLEMRRELRVGALVVAIVVVVVGASFAFASALGCWC